MRRLTNAELSAATKVLIGPMGEDVSQAVFKLALGDSSIDERVIDELSNLNWFHDGEFTELGRLIKDPLREFGFWIERNRLLPSEASLEVLNRERFRNKSLLELGSGGGCNLLSLTGIPKLLTGLEPMPLYLQMMEILAQMANLPKPDAIEAGAENIPLADEIYDVVICYSSHQYMDINTAMAEMARVLKPGGELIIIGNSFYPFVGECLINFFKNRNLGRAKFDLIAIINTLYYQLFGRRLITGKGSTTVTPIYPSGRYMARLLKKNRLIKNEFETCSVSSGETVLISNKKA